MFFSGNRSGVEWSVQVKVTPNGTYHAFVKVGTWHAIGQDQLSQEEAKNDGCNMMAERFEEIEEVVNA